MPGQGAGPPEARAGASAAPRATFAALAVPNFRRYISGQALSLIGTWVETVAQALLVCRGPANIGCTSFLNVLPLVADEALRQGADTDARPGD
jgi:hypothetical protein